MQVTLFFGRYVFHSCAGFVSILFLPWVCLATVGGQCLWLCLAWRACACLRHVKLGLISVGLATVVLAEFRLAIPSLNWLRLSWSGAVWLGFSPRQIPPTLGRSNRKFATLPSRGIPVDQRASSPISLALPPTHKAPRAWKVSSRSKGWSVLEGRPQESLQRRARCAGPRTSLVGLARCA